ncbi:MAG: MATE family efflux transporter [Clostridium sp.]|nr:MATE family efflux transporter [Clostridium sp.]
MKDLTKGNPLKLIIMFALPVFIGNVFQLLYSLVDTKIVGETLGDISLAAVGATNPINTLVVGFLIGITNGFAVVVARYFGAKDFKNLRKSVASSLSLGIITAVILTFLSVVFLLPLLRLLNTPENVIMQSYDYIKIIFLGMIISMIYNVCASMLRAIGDTVTPLIFLIFSAIMNIFLDYLFILNFNLGVQGAAYATVLSQFVSAIMCIIYIIKRYPEFHLKKSDFVFSKDLVRELYKSGCSMGFMMSLVSLGTVALQGSINTFGTDIIVAHTAARKITEIFMIMFSVFGTTMATYCGQNLGAGKIKRIKEGIKIVIFITWCWSLLMIIITYLFAPKIISFITGSTNSEVIYNATLYLKIDTLFYFVPAMISIFRNSMQGIGDHSTPIVSSLIELIGKFVIAVSLAPAIGYTGIILAEPIVWNLMVIPLIIKLKANPVLRENCDNMINTLN